MKQRVCIRCHRKKLGKHNASGFCGKCYRHSPQYLEYQRIFQKKLYKEHPEKARKYHQRPEIKKKTREYMKIYRKKHIVKLREQKNEWARKNRRKQK